MQTGKAILGTIVGLAAGATLGVLFAPEKKIIIPEDATDLGDDLEDALGKIIERKFDELNDSVNKHIHEEYNNSHVNKRF